MLKTLLAVAATGMTCVISSTAMAQALPPAETPAVFPLTVAAPAIVPKGTAIVVEFADAISSRTAKQDDMFTLKLAEPVMLNGVVVIPVGTLGKGQVIDAARAGMSGKPAKLVLAGRYLEVAGRQVPIRGLRSVMGGKDDAGGAAVASIVIGVFALAVTGGEVDIPPGTRAAAKLGADFVPSDAAPAVPAPDAQAPQTEVPQSNTVPQAAIPNTTSTNQSGEHNEAH